MCAKTGNSKSSLYVGYIYVFKNKCLQCEFSVSLALGMASEVIIIISIFYVDVLKAGPAAESVFGLIKVNSPPPLGSCPETNPVFLIAHFK